MDQIRQQRFIYNYFFGSLHCRLYFKKIFYISLLFILFCNADWFYLHLCRYEERCIMWARSQELQNLHKWQYEHCTAPHPDPPRGQQPHVVSNPTWSATPRGQLLHVVSIATWTVAPRGQQPHVVCNSTWSATPRGQQPHMVCNPTWSATPRDQMPYVVSNQTWSATPRGQTMAKGPNDIYCTTDTSEFFFL